MPSYALRVNGTTRNVNVEPDTPLLYVLRNDLELNGPRFGCGLSQCGTCTVLVEGKPTRSCVMTMVALNNRPVTTLEGLGTAGKPHPLQKAFIEEQQAKKHDEEIDDAQRALTGLPPDWFTRGQAPPGPLEQPEYDDVSPALNPWELKELERQREFEEAARQ